LGSRAEGAIYLPHAGPATGLLLLDWNPVGYADERLDLIARLRRQFPGRQLADALRLDGRALRFHVGTSLADLRVPVSVDPHLQETFRAAVRDLFFLLSIRHRAALKEQEYERLLLLDGFDPRAARVPSFVAPASVTREGIRKAFLEAPELHPALDSGVVASWISAGRPGRVLVGALNAVLKRALEEPAAQELREPTAYLALLALRGLSQGALGMLKDLPVTGPVGRHLHGAVAAGLLVAVRLASREAGLPQSSSGLQCETAATAIPWIGGMRFLPGSGLQCYGLPFDNAVPRLDQFAQKILQGGGTPETVAREVAMELASSKDASKKMTKVAGLAKLRGELLQLLRMSEAGRAPQLSVEGSTLAQLYQTPGALERVLSGTALRKEMAAKAKTTAKGATNEPARTLLESIALAAREWKEEHAGSYLAVEPAMKAWANAVSALAVDEALERALDQAESQIVHRTGAESEGGIATAYDGGKLYLFAIDEKPILMGRSRSLQMGHLFCDMKDFTKRTAFLKETVVAEFLSREFYGPILTAAARHAHGAAHLADKGGIYLNNLLGDAVSFSGQIVSLLELADDIRHALGSYARRLDSEAGSETVAKTIAGIEEKFRARREQLDALLQSAQAALSRGTLDPTSGEEPSHRIRVLQGHQQGLDEERETEIALASGEKLEAGIFISYGAAPEVAMFEDHIFGRIKVSIAEKINESARGTARNMGVRARVEAILAAERARLGRADLICRLSVAVSQPLSMPIPADVELAVRRSVASGDLEDAEMVMGASVRDFVARLAAEDAVDGRGDIYNGGVAISEEALKAYVEGRGSDLTFLRREVEAAALHEVIRERFVFPMPSLKLVMAVASASQSLQELFVFVGRALFKGFEKQGGLGVYEMIAREAPFFMLLAQHHVPAWLRDQEEGREPEAGEWRPVALG